MDYVVISTSVTDDITLASGESIGRIMGGAGSYALCGIKLWCDSVQLVTGVGKDYPEAYRAWFARNGVDQSGLLVKDDHTAVSQVRYFHDGERKETPRFGLAHYQKLEATPEEATPFLKDAKGVYVFKNLNPSYWNRMLALKKTYGFRLMWEINASCARRESLSEVKRLAERVDVFSINRAEALALTGRDTLAAVQAELAAWSVPMIYLRKGAEGASVIAGGICADVPSVAGVRAVDATGGGNSSSAGVLYAYCRGYDAYACGVTGSISAAACIGQYGMPPVLDAKMREKSRLLFQRMLNEQTQRI